MTPARMGVDTPPSSDIELDVALPPSPPLSPKPPSSVDRILGVLRLRRAGRLAHEYRSFTLLPGHFAELQQRIEDDASLRGWFHDKVCWDFDPHQHRFSLRMPTRVHERFIALVDDAIRASIDELSEEIPALNDVYQARSTTLELHAPRLENSSQSSQGSREDVVVHRSPDATFYHRRRDALPVLVVEVSYSQQRKDLPRLAESYIVDSRHEIRCVVGLDLTYAGKGKKTDQTASVSVWRRGMEPDEDGEDVGVCRCDVDAQVFRGSGGNVREGSVEIRLDDLLPEDLSNETLAEKSVNISFERLAAFLADAEEGARSATTVKSESSSAPKKFRKRKRSPSEELSDGREAMYQKLEEAEVEKERKKDNEWKGLGWTTAGAENEAAIEVVERRRSKRNKSGGAAGEGS